MSNLSARELLRRFPNASKSTLQANYGTQIDPETVRPRKTSELECPAGDGALGSPQGKEENPERVLIRFVSVRKRLLDPDNLSEKWLLDCLRYCRVVQGDEPDKITLETTQRKCLKGEEERTEIFIYQA